MLKTFRKDLIKYRNYSQKNGVLLLLTQQGLWALFVYRISHSIYRSKLPVFFKKVLLIPAVFFQKIIEIITGISIPYAATIGERFYIGHFGGIIINSKAIFGHNCNISQGVTIGVSGTGDKRGVPSIGNNVYIGANATVAGKIHIGDNVVIGANSLVTSDVPSNCTVLGVPAVKISDRDSGNYI
jgi:serine O-acetyltransferase